MAVKRATAVEKTEEAVKDEASATTYVKEFLVQVDDPSNVAEDIIENNKNAVVTELEQKGLRINGDVTLTGSEPKSDNSVMLTYSAKVKSATESK